MELRIKKYLLLGLLLIGGFVISKGQNNVREKVYLHLSNNELIVGETLYFSCYVYSEATGKLSSLSSILYLDVLDEDNKSVFRTQIDLEQGTGDGQYYLPTELETGNYNIVAYTRWMQNFNDLYYQRITIINPYKTYYNPSQTVEAPTISFYPEGGRLLNNFNNRVVIRSSDQFGQGKIVEGRVIDKSGNTIAKVETDRFGCFRFAFIPKEKETYQLITESNSGFNFYDLPSTCEKCTRLHVDELGGYYIIDLKSSLPQESKHELLIIHNKVLVKRLLVKPNSETQIKKSDLPDGLNVIVLNVNDAKYCERIIWKGDFVTTDPETAIDKYSTLENASTSVYVEKPSSLSISVTKVSPGSGSAKSIAFDNTIDEQLVSPLTDVFKDALTAETLDDFLISSRLKPDDLVSDNVALLPEYRYAIIQGTLTSSGEEKKPLANETVGLSFMGKNDNISVTTTDTAGRFSLMYDYKTLHQVGTIKALNKPSDSYEIIVREPYYTQYPKFLNPPIQLDSGKIQQIVKRSIDNQIQNAYYLPDSTQSKSQKSDILSGAQSFFLNEYTRFPTMRDTFIEIIYDVGVSKNEDKYELRMRMDGIGFGDKQLAPTLLLLDGVFVTAKDILQISPYAVERIDVLNRRYYFGGIFFNGVIAVHTFKNDMANMPLDDHLAKPVETLNFNDSSKVVSIHASERVPHYEHMLLWKPHVLHPGGKLKIDFTTSDVEGLYEINVEGIANDGTPISEKRYFRVSNFKAK